MAQSNEQVCDCIYGDGACEEHEDKEQGGDSQDDLLDFVNDPETLKRAVEGSMEKRLRVMAQSNGELHAALRECFKADPNYAEILNLTGDMGIHDIESRIIAVFEAYRKQHELDARIDEVRRQPGITDGNGWGSEWQDYRDERLSTLKAEREAL